MKHKLSQFLSLLDKDKWYQCPDDIFGHSNVFLNGAETIERLKDITGDHDLSLNQTVRRQCWNKTKLEFEEREITVIQLHTDFKPEYSLD